MKVKDEDCVEDEEIDMIRNHILAFEFLPVHYSRKEGDEQCLPSYLNVSLMYRKFKEDHPNHPDVEHKKWLYRKVFKETGILPYQPKSDTCRTCDRLHIQSLGAETEEQNEVIQNQIMEHLIRGESGFKNMYQDIEMSRNDPDLVVLCTDLQKVLFTPTLTHSDMFYSRKLSTYNLCIYDGKNDIGNMCLWNETEGKRGVNEMASCLYHYIHQTFQPLGVGMVRRLVLWSDRCRGQFNNFPILCLLISFIREGYFTEVEQKFLLSGHSFMTCDRLFGLIEKRKKSCQAYIPDHWERIILEAQPSKPFTMHKLNNPEIFDVKSFENIVPRPSSLKVTEVARVLISRDMPSKLLTRNSHCDEVWSPHDLLAPRAHAGQRNRAALNFLQVNFAFAPCYDGPIPLSQEKKKDFRAFLEYLQPHHRAFYEQLLNI